MAAVPVRGEVRADETAEAHDGCARRRREEIAEALLPVTGHRLVLAREYRRSRDHPAEIVSAVQSEFTSFVNEFEGRRRRPSSRCEVRSWTGDFDGIFPLPDGRLAAVRWNDQTEAGLVLVELGD